MRTKVYNKLVRDKIPEIIEASGKTCTCETLRDGQYIEFLNQKLLEEVNEYLESGLVEELADIGEVMHASWITRESHWKNFSVSAMQSCKSAVDSKRESC